MMRLSRDHVSLEDRLANMMCFWALWHVAWVVKSIPFFKLTIEHIAPKYLLIEMVVMLFCLNCWFVPAGAPQGFRVGVSTDVLSIMSASNGDVSSVCLVRVPPSLRRTRSDPWSSSYSRIAKSFPQMHCPDNLCMHAALRAPRSLVPRNPIIIPATDERLAYPRLIRRKWLPIHSPYLRAGIRVADAGALSDIPDTDGRVGATTGQR